MGEVAEVPEGDLEAPELRLRGHRGRSLRFADQGELPEVVAGAELPDLRAVHADRGPAVGDDEEADAAHLPLAHDRGARLERALPEVPGELLQLAIAELGEQRYALQLVGGGSQGSPILRDVENDTHLPDA